MGALDDILGTKPVADGRAARGVTTVAPVSTSAASAANAPASPAANTSVSPAPPQPTPQTDSGAARGADGLLTESALAESRLRHAGMPTAEAKAKAAALQQPAPAQEAQVAQPERLGYAEMYRRLSPFVPPTAEELEQERRREKREKLFASIGDGISALSNLFFTTQYAPNRFDAQSSQAAKVNDRWEKLRAERAANMRAYTDGLMRAQAMDDEAGHRERTWQHTLAREERADKLENAKAVREQKLFELDLQLQGEKISAAAAEAKRKEIEATYADALEEAKVKTEEAHRKQLEASAGASRAKAHESRAHADYYERNGGKGKTSLELEDGTHYYNTDDDYERAVQRAAKQYGIATHQDVTTQEYGGYDGQKTRKVSTPKPISQLAGEVEEAAARRRREKQKEAPPKKPAPAAPPKKKTEKKQGWASDLRL